MTISTRGGHRPGPKKAAAALYRRGRRHSLAKTSHRRNNLAAAARFVPEGGQAGKRVPTLLGLAFSPAMAGLWQDVFQLGPGPPWIGISRQGQLLRDDFADIQHIPRKRLGGVGV